jgi:hypothetical protein
VEVLPHNITSCLLAGHSPSLCAWFHAFAANATSSGCFERGPSGDVEPAVASGCLNASRCIALYGVPACVGPAGFNYSLAAFNFTACSALVRELNASLAGNLSLTNVTGCEALMPAETAEEEVIGNLTERPPPPPLPHFHPCVEAMQSDEVLRKQDVVRRAELYTSHLVLALSPRIGPVAGGVSVGVCGLGFTQTNEAVSHLRCRFTDGRNRVDVPAVYVDEQQLRCQAPDFSNFAVGLPHKVSVEVSTGRGGSWTNNKVPFTYFSTRPSIDAFGRPMWGYEPTFTKAAWQVEFSENEYGSHVEPLYPATGHPLNGGRPSPWDAPRDPFHTEGADASWMPVELDTGDRMEPAHDLTERIAQAKYHGVEGSWGDRMSFLRAHSLVPDTYRKDVVASRAEMRRLAAETNNGVI